MTDTLLSYGYWVDRIKSNTEVLERINDIIYEHKSELPDWVDKPKFYAVITQQIIDQLALAIIDGDESLDVTYILGSCLVSDYWDVGASGGLVGLVPHCKYDIVETFGNSLLKKG